MTDRARELRTRPVILLAVTSMTAALVLAGCTRFGPPRPDVPYQADVRIEVVEDDGQRRRVEQLTEFYAFGLRRRQATIEGDKLVVIDRPDLFVSWVLDPDARDFDEYRMRSREVDAIAPPDPFGPRAGGRYEALGPDEIDGVAVIRFQVQGKAVHGFAWISEDGVPLRFEGRVGEGADARTVRIDYGEVQRGPQAAYLFTIPPNYAGYEDRKQRSSERENRDVEDAIDRLQNRRKTRPNSVFGM